MSDIFLSYKSEDRARAKILAEALEQQGFTVWWDPKIDHGDIFDDAIQKELDVAKCVLVLWSKKSVKSKWVRAEATSGENRLVPVLIDDVNIPVPFNLTQTANLIDWEGNLSHPEFSRLVGSVSKKLGRSSVGEKGGMSSPKESISRHPVPSAKGKRGNLQNLHQFHRHEVRAHTGR